MDTNYPWLRYSNQSATRNKPISDKLIGTMSFLGDLGITMDVVSGGQDAAGVPNARRTGSDRHDHGNAADVDFYQGDRKLDWNNPDDMPLLTNIIQTARKNGVTGIGAGDDYMGAGRFHIGFGSEATWGARGSSKNTPEFLARMVSPEAVSTSWLGPDNKTTVPIADAILSNDANRMLGNDPRYAMSATDANNYRPLPKDPQLQEATMNGNISTGGPALMQTSSNQGALNQSNATQEELTGIQKLLQGPEWLTKDRGQMLLALGSGLLSGNDWASGLSAAGQNAAGVMQVRQSREQQLADEQRLRQQQLMDIDRERGWQLEDSERNFNQELTLQQQAAKNTATSSTVMNIVGRDPETGAEVVRAGSMKNGVLTVNENGVDVPASSLMQEIRIGGRNETQDVTSGAGNIPNAISISSDGEPAFDFKRESEAKNYGYAIRAIGADRDMEAMSSEISNEQLTSLTNTMKRWSSENAENGVTEAVINTWMNESGITGAYAATARVWLQAILRSDTGAAYTGVEIKDYASSFLPAAGDNVDTLAQKRRLRARELSRFAATTGAAAPYLGQVISGQRELSGGYYTQLQKPALDQSDAQTLDPSIDEILKKYGQ